MRAVRLALAASLFASPLAAQAAYDTVKVVPQKVADGLYVLFGAGGNIGLAVGSDATFLIDDQFAPLTPKITAAVAGITASPVKFLLNTHWHGDHTGGNEHLGQAGVLIFAHDNVRQRMSTPQFIARLKQNVPASPAIALPVVTFNDSTTFHLNGEDIVAFHVRNAHTDGDVMVHFRKANVVHTGDVFVRYGFPFIDASSGGTVLGTIAAVERLLAATNADTKFIPGHGPVSTRADVERYRTMLVTVRDRVAAAVKAGKAPEAYFATHPLADLDPEWGKGFISGDVFVETLFRELQAANAAAKPAKK